MAFLRSLSFRFATPVSGTKLWKVVEIQTKEKISNWKIWWHFRTNPSPGIFEDRPQSPEQPTISEHCANPRPKLKTAFISEASFSTAHVSTRCSQTRQALALRNESDCCPEHTQSWWWCRARRAWRPTRIEKGRIGSIALTHLSCSLASQKTIFFFQGFFFYLKLFLPGFQNQYPELESQL